MDSRRYRSFTIRLRILEEIESEYLYHLPGLPSLLNVMGLSYGTLISERYTSKILWGKGLNLKMGSNLHHFNFRIGSELFEEAT